MERTLVFAMLRDNGMIHALNPLNSSTGRGLAQDSQECCETLTGVD